MEEDIPVCQWDLLDVSGKRWSPMLDLQTSCCRSWILPNNSICVLSENCIFPTMPKNFELITCFVSSTSLSPSRRDLCVKSWLFSFLSYTIINFMTLHRWSQLSSQPFGEKVSIIIESFCMNMLIAESYFCVVGMMTFLLLSLVSFLEEEVSSLHL